MKRLFQLTWIVGIVLCLSVPASAEAVILLRDYSGSTKYSVVDNRPIEGTRSRGDLMDEVIFKALDILPLDNIWLMPWSEETYEPIGFIRRPASMANYIQGKIQAIGGIGSNTSTGKVMNHFLHDLQCKALIFITEEKPDDYHDFAQILPQVLDRQPVTVLVLDYYKRDAVMQFFKGLADRPNYRVLPLTVTNLVSVVPVMMKETSACNLW